jgi:tRNA(Met) C34 N-acetyltransferase TmcA
VSTAQLRREISHLRKRRPPRGHLVSEDRLEFAQSLEIVPDLWQEQLLGSEAPRILLNCSRQSGKSTMASILALHKALSRPGSLILILAPAERQAKELFSKVATFYRTLGHIIPMDSYRKLGMNLASGSRIEALPGTEKTIRGFSGVDLLIVDEAARVADELYYTVRLLICRRDPCTIRPCRGGYVAKSARVFRSTGTLIFTQRYLYPTWFLQKCS